MTKKEENADEQAKLAYMGVRTEIIAEIVTNASYNASDHTEELGQKVERDLDPKQEKKTWSVDYTTTGIITMIYTDNSLKNTNHQIVYTIELPGVGGTAVTLKKDGTLMSTGGDTPVTPTQDSEPETSAITYPEGKDGATVTTGDTISITFKEGTEIYTEDFMVLSEEPDEDNKIMAMPYYNLYIAGNPTTIKQATEDNYSSAGTLAFAAGSPRSQYWGNTKGNIPMNNPANNVQPYITAYNKKIALATGGKEEAQIGRYYNDGESTG